MEVDVSRIQVLSAGTTQWISKMCVEDLGCLVI